MIAYIGDIIVVVILIVALTIGAKKGFLGVVVGFLAGILTFVLATVLCEPVAALIGDTFGLGGVLETAFTGMFDSGNEILNTPVKELAADKIAEVIAGFELPEFISAAILDLVNTEIESVAVSENLTLLSIIVTCMVNVTLSAIAWVLLFIVLIIVFALLKKVVKLFNNIPVVGPINRLLGAVLCLILAVLVLLVLMYVFALLSPTLPQGAIDYVNGSVILKWMYNNNPLGLLITNLFA